MKQITITLNVSPSAAVRNRTSQCGDVTFTLSEPDLAALTEDQIDGLARHVAEEGRYNSGGNVAWYCKLTDFAPPVAAANLATLASLLDTRRAKIAELEAERQAGAAANTERANARVRSILADGVRTEVVHLEADGTPTSYGGIFDIETIRIPYHATDEGADPEHCALFQAWLKDIETERAAAIADAQPLVVAKVAEIAAAKAAIAAEHAELFARLPDAFQARRAAGFASDAETKEACRALLRADAGYADALDPDDWRSEDKLETLTDEQFARHQEIVKDAPAGAVVTPLKVWDYREAEQDEYEEADRDGEVPCNVRVVYRVRWTRAGIQVDAYLK